MHLFYIDESGTGLGDSQSPYFVMATMAVPDETWQEVDSQVAALNSTKRPGMELVDQRSTLHSSTQDRRLLDAYRDWLASRSGYTNLIEVPWFGFSAFYAGLQLADFAAYMIDRISNDEKEGKRNEALRAPFKRYESQVHLVHIP
jgi:hypothetical protein